MQCKNSGRIRLCNKNKEPLAYGEGCAGESQTLKMTLEKRDLASFDEANSQWKVDAGNYLFKVGSDVENIKGTATLKVAEYTEKTSNACAPNVQLNYLKQNK